MSLMFSDIPDGSCLLDVGCGAGLDSLVAARRCGTSGRVVGSDFSWTMVSVAAQAARELRLFNVMFVVAAAERLPLATASIDVVLVNGIFNLNPLREMIFPELARVMKTGGRLYAAELVLKADAPPAGVSEDDWFA